MFRILTMTAVVLLMFFSADLSAQGSAYRKKTNHFKKGNKEAEKNAKKQSAKARRNIEEEERETEREEAKEERREARAGDDEEGISINGAAVEDDEPKPGSTVERAVKDKVIEDVMDELDILDEDQRDDFKKIVRDAWDDTEKQDKRYASDYKKAMDDSDKLAKEKAEHQEKLKEIWDEADEDLLKKKAVTDEQLAAWQKSSNELRTKTNTDRYYESLKDSSDDQPEDEQDETPDTED